MYPNMITLLLFLIIVLVVIFTIYFLTRNESKEPVKVDPAPVKVDPPVKTSTGAIAGGIGGAVVLCLILLAVFFYSRRPRLDPSVGPVFTTQRTNFDYLPSTGSSQGQTTVDSTVGSTTPLKAYFD